MRRKNDEQQDGRGKADLFSQNKQHEQEDVIRRFIESVPENCDHWVKAIDGVMNYIESMNLPLTREKINALTTLIFLKSHFSTTANAIRQVFGTDIEKFLLP